jgi:hypothetical protein
MTSRLDKLIKVRRVASRNASGIFGESAARAADHAMLVDRIDGASRILAPQEGFAAGGILAAQLELAERMRAAGALARHRAELAFAERQDAAVERKAAMRALDAAIDIRRAGDRADLRRHEAKSIIPLAKVKP